MKHVPLELIQAAADALLRFPDLPNDVREQFDGYINGNWVNERCDAMHRCHKAGLKLREIAWVYLTDLTQEHFVTYWLERYKQCTI
jgi:hypothetical protein